MKKKRKCVNCRDEFEIEDPEIIFCKKCVNLKYRGRASNLVKIYHKM